MKNLYVLTIISLVTLTSFGQAHRLKGNGQVFWEEQFNWEDPSAPRGWTLPAGWKIEDNSEDQNGYVWGWTKDSMQGPMARRDGGYILNSATNGNGFLAIDLDGLNAGKTYAEMLWVNSTITLPIMNFSSHPSVIIGLEQMFKYFSNPKMIIQVSNDNGGHWADFDLKMGTSSGVNTMNLQNSQVASYSANISEVAAGQPSVIIRFTWSGSMLYFWMLDDITFREGWDYDLKMNYSTVGLMDNNPDADAGFLYMMPKTQILPIGNFEAAVLNYGDKEMNNIRFQAEVFKNGVSQFREGSETLNYRYFGDPADTLVIEKTYTPTDFGHYEMVLEMKSDEADQNHENSRKSYLFHVTDSVFARTPDSREADDSPWRDYYQYTHEGDMMAVQYDPIADCEASSISAYISKANEGADFRFVLLEITPVANQQPVTRELLTTEMMSVDSTVLEQGWITMKFDLDGIGEKMKAGKKYLAAVEFWTYISAENLINRKNAFWLGSTKSYPGSFDKQWRYETAGSEWKNGSTFNKMIRLNINNHENRIDGISNQAVSFDIEQNYPNPFSGETHISFTLAMEQQVDIEIRDITGKVILAINKGRLAAGKHAVTIPADGIRAGTYFYTFKTDGGVITRQMIVLN
jgi:hypothetical protein